VVATLPGRDPTGRVLLSAHYDTTAGSPGAADDKAAVAAMLETVRALTSGERLRNDVVMLLSDGEEPGLLGAAAFVAEHRARVGGGVVLNWEATGNAGPSVLFETSPGDAELVRVLAAVAPSPVGDSALAAGYEAGNQNTDFNVLRDAGYAGLNFALVDGTAYYHSSQDTLAALDPRSVQHTGETMLALTRALGPGSSPVRLDAEKTMFGQRSVARRVARTVFIGSSPTAGSPNRGLEDRRMRLGCAMPGESPALFGDALRSLTDRATYLYVDRERSWYDVQPSVTRKAADLSERLRQQPDVTQAAIIKRLELTTRHEARGAFADVHIAPVASGDVGDEARTRLVILSPETPHLSKLPSPALEAAAELLDQRGNGPRNYRNMLVFLAPDERRLEDLERSVRDHLAWTEIVDRAEEFELSTFQIRQAETRQRQTDEAAQLRIMQAYQWLLVPTQPDPIRPIEWTVLRVNGEGSLAERASQKLMAEDLLRLDMAAVLVRMDLDRSLAPLWESGDVEVAQLWDAYARYCYLPRPRDADVLLRAVATGPAHPEWLKETFAVATVYDRATGRYHDLTIGRAASPVTMQSLVVQPFLAEAQADLDDHRARSPSSTVPSPAPTRSAVTSSVVRPSRRERPHRFRATVTFRSPRPAQDLQKLEREVLQHLATSDDMQVVIHLEIDVSTASGIPDDTVSTVTENARALGFDEYRFEE
jgi:hypothetical protein